MRQTNKHPGVTDLWAKKTGAEQTALRRRGAKRYKVRYVKPDGGQGSRTFQFQEQALDFRAELKREPEEVVAHAAQSATVRDVMTRWLDTKGDLEPNTVIAYQQDARGVVEAFGDQPASLIDEHGVQVWSTRQSLGSSMRRKQVVAMKAAFHAATRGTSRLLALNPLADLPLPRADARDPKYLDWGQLEDLADAMGTYKPLVWVLGNCGIRLEEAAQLDVQDVDRRKRLLYVRKSKTASGRNRWVPVDPEVLAMLPTDPGPVFRSPEGGRLNSHNWRERVWKPIVAEVFDFSLTPHELRHTAASLAIDSGADAVKVANMLGHADPSVTYKIYAHRFEARSNDVADKMFAEKQAARARRGRLRDDSASKRTTERRLTTSTGLH